MEKQGFFLYADDAFAGSFEPKVNFRLKHALNLFSSMNFELGINLRNLGWGTDAFFIETKGHIEI